MGGLREYERALAQVMACDAETLLAKYGGLKMVEKSSSYKKSRLMWMVLLVLFGTSIARTQKSKVILSVQDKRALISEIKAAERNLFSNLKVESEAWVETKVSLSDPCEFWQRTPIYWSATACFSGNWSSRRWNADQHTFERHIQGKARVDVHKRVLEWQEGAAPYRESSYSMGWDGQYGKMTHHTVGYNAKTHPVKEGKLLSEAPTSLETNAFTGTGFSLQFFEGEIYKFSKMFELASDPNSEATTELKFTREEFEGIDCIKISSKFDNLMYWLDPSHGFALRGKKSIDIFEDGREELISFMKVSKLKEIATGIWWPIEAYIISRPYESGKPWQRFVYWASNVVANDPNFDESIFTVPFPDGYLIDDKVAGRKYRVGEDPNIPKNQSKK